MNILLCIMSVYLMLQLSTYLSFELRLAGIPIGIAVARQRTIAPKVTSGEQYILVTQSENKI